jgi:hypothetical protein
MKIKVKKYLLRIEETLARVVEIEAENIEDAIDIVKLDYKNEKIVLDSSNYVETSFEPIND